MKMNKIQVTIISQQYMYRQGIEHSIAAVEDIVVTGSAGIGDDVLTAIDLQPPDVALIDIDTPGDSGLKLSRRIKQRLPNVGVIILTANTDDAQVLQALKAQAGAYHNKEITADELVETIRRVARGEHPINESLTTRPKLAEQVLNQFQELSLRAEAEGFISPLTPREIEILNYIAQGFLNKQIAAQLDISEQTIKNHVTSILRKLNANARTEAVVVAIKQGLISID
jgi:DNA-binding NarL/FixJ family response regulator